jgi:uncharacterized tellurite resistance protein B-like protein
MNMALKELERLTEELKNLTSKLRGEVSPSRRMALIIDIHRILARIESGVHG